MDINTEIHVEDRNGLVQDAAPTEGVIVPGAGSCAATAAELVVPGAGSCAAVVRARA